MNAPVNCGRCANLARGGASPGYGRCGSHARQIQTGEVLPLMSLEQTCEFAKLSAKYDPDFLPKWKRGLWKGNEIVVAPATLEPESTSDVMAG